jgi:hypothetical protein
MASVCLVCLVMPRCGRDSGFGLRDREIAAARKDS